MELQGLKGRSLALALFMSCMPFAYGFRKRRTKNKHKKVKMTVMVLKMTAVVKRKQMEGIETMRKKMMMTTLSLNQ